MTYFVRYTYREWGTDYETTTVVETDNYLKTIDDIESLVAEKTGDFVQKIKSFSQINIGYRGKKD